MSRSLTNNYIPRKCNAPIVYFSATLSDAERNPENFVWKNYTTQPITMHLVEVKHAEMLWQPNSYQYLAKVIQEFFMKISS